MTSGFRFHVEDHRERKNERRRRLRHSRTAAANIILLHQRSSIGSCQDLLYTPRPTNMKFTSFVLWSVIVSSASAFTPKPLILPTTTKAAAQDGGSPLWRPPMNMAAGGAERAPEYYDGT